MGLFGKKKPVPKPRVVLGNDYIYLQNMDGEFAIIRELDRATSFKVAGAERSDAHQAWLAEKAGKTHFRGVPLNKLPKWDGREHLLKYLDKHQAYRLPAGFHNEVCRLLPYADYEDKRHYPDSHKVISWRGPELRDYQQGAVNAVLNATPQRGILHMAIRSGKTLTVAYLLHKLGQRAVFVVPSQLLLTQTAEVFEKVLGGVKIGKIGDGEFRIGWITIATYQSIVKHAAKALPLLDACGVVVIDEAHHLSAPEWRKPILACNAPVKLGVSGTIFEDGDNRPREAQQIWLRAICGPILYRVSTDDLIDRGYLTPAKIFAFEVPRPDDYVEPRRWHEAQDVMIVDHEVRTNMIADLAEDQVALGKRVLVDTKRLRQVDNIVATLRKRHVEVEKITGSTPSAQRQKILKKFRKGKLLCVVGTVLGEGIDIPELEVVIVAGGGQSRVAAVQRLRNLTMSEGKKEALIIDFVDGRWYWDMARTLKRQLGPKAKKTTDRLAGRLYEHSKERFQVYQDVQGFDVTFVEWDKKRKRTRIPKVG